MTEFISPSSRKWEDIKSSIVPEEYKEDWLPFWDHYISLKTRINDPEHQDFDTVSSLDQDQESMMLNFDNVIRDVRDFRGFMLAADHENEDVRLLAANSIRYVWEADDGDNSGQEIAKLAYNRLMHDGNEAVRQYALENIMLMLWGQGIESTAHPSVLSSGEKYELTRIFTSAIYDLNRFVGTSTFTKTDA